MKPGIKRRLEAIFNDATVHTVSCHYRRAIMYALEANASAWDLSVRPRWCDASFAPAVPVWKECRCINGLIGSLLCISLHTRVHPFVVDLRPPSFLAHDNAMWDISRASRRC